MNECSSTCEAYADCMQRAQEMSWLADDKGLLVDGLQEHVERAILRSRSLTEAVIEEDPHGIEGLAELNLHGLKVTLSQLAAGDAGSLLSLLAQQNGFSRLLLDTSNDLVAAATVLINNCSIGPITNEQGKKFCTSEMQEVIHVVTHKIEERLKEE